MAFSRGKFRLLSTRQREFLLSHIDGPRRVTVSSHMTRAALLSQRLIRCDRDVHPRITTLTDDGRRAVSFILADAADALVAAGVLDDEAAAVISAFIKSRDDARQTREISQVAPL